MSTYDHSNNIIPNAKTFLSLIDHAAVVLGDWAYIDGGLVSFLDQSNNEQVERLNITLAIDLRSKWTSESVRMLGIDKAGSPILSNTCLWSNAQGSAAYSFAGGEDWGLWSGKGDSSTEKPTLWMLKPDNNGGAVWSNQSTANNGFPNTRPQNGLQTSRDGIGYYLGGYLNWGTYPNTLDPDHGLMVVPDLIVYNSTANTWQNITIPGFESARTASYGGAQIVPSFGTDGLGVFFGGYANSTKEFDYSSTKLGFDSIAILDLHTGAWYHQSATNSPNWRADFCVVGVPGDNGTYEIFMYGGTDDPLSGKGWVNGAKPPYPDSGKVNQEQLLDEVYVLSLPSFNWVKASYTAVTNRFGHTCHVVGAGQRQMLSIGGENFAVTRSNLSTTHKDAFAQGLGVFDLTNMKWLNSYDPNASPYQTPQKVKDYISISPTPNSWSDPQLAKIFSTYRDASALSPAVPPPTPSPSKTPVGAIAGGVVGGIAFLILLMLAIEFLIRRPRRRRAQSDESQQGSGFGISQGNNTEYHNEPRRIAETSGVETQQLVMKDKPSELETGQSAEAWELDAQQREEPVLGELPGDTEF